MNNGNSLSSLLGITSTNPAVTKATAAKARAESTEKFQQALEQARPEVAARKSVVRKESLPPENSSAARATPKSTAQRNSPHEANRTDASSRARDNRQDAAHKVAEKPEISARDSAVSEGAVEQENKQRIAADGQAQQNEDGVVEQSVHQASVATDALLLADAALSVGGETGVADNPLNPANMPLSDLADLTTAGEADLSQTHNEAVLVEPALLDSGLLASQPVLMSLTPDVSRGANLSADTAAASIAEVQSAAIQVASGALTDKLAGDELALGDADAEVPANIDADAGENPDFLLLSSKAALNKLSETAMTAATLDKTAHADVAKPAAINAAVETLTRMTEAQSPSARAFVVQTGVPVTVGTPQWSQAVGDKVLWLAAQNVSSAEIRLDPPELGPMQVRVSVNQDQASVTFTSPHPAVREALDQQLTRLREMFSEQGLNLVNVDVSDKSFAQREREQGDSAKQQANTGLDDEELTPVGITQAISMRLVDHYA